MGKKKEAPAADQVAENAEASAVAAEKLKHNKKLAVVGKYEDTTAITWNITSNPRAAGKATHTRFAAYFGTATVGAYMAAGGTKGDLLWDLRAGYLSIEGVSLSDDPALRAPRAKAERKPKADKEAVKQEDKEAEVATETID